MNYDFHSHTDYSDGVLTPEQLVLRAEEKGLDLLAISDHDSVSGLQQAKEAIKSHQLNLTVVNGSEFSAQSDFGEIHIVGLNIDPENEALLSAINTQQKKRWKRVELFEEKFQKLDVKGVLDQLKENCREVVTRSHVAKALISLGYVKDNNQAFKKYLGKKGRVKVATDWLAMDQVISVIHSAGGLAVLAHPTRYPMSMRRLSYLIEEFRYDGGDGLELSYPSLTPDKRGWLEVQRKKNDLLASGGSDFHYPNLKWTDLGRFSAINKETPHVLNLIKDSIKS